MLICALLQQPQIRDTVLPEPLEADPPPSPFSNNRNNYRKFDEQPLRLCDRFDDRRPKSTHVRNENKYNLTPEELETYRSLGKKERKQFLKDRS